MVVTGAEDGLGCFGSGLQNSTSSQSLNLVAFLFFNSGNFGSYSQLQLSVTIYLLVPMGNSGVSLNSSLHSL